MKPIVTTIFLLLLNIANAQDLQGIATYRSTQKIDLKIDSTKANDAMKRQMEADLRKEFDKDHTLKFNKSESLFEEEEQLERPEAKEVRVLIIGHNQKAVLYKNTASRRFVRQEDLLGKIFLVKDTLILPDWKISSESKKIGKYTCYKATWTRNKEGENWSKDKGVSTSVNEIITTAWYTPEIPVNTGPKDYWGLPGLILEIQEGDFSLLCTGVTLNPSEKFGIDAPEKGKPIDQKSFEEIRREKNAELREQMMKSRENVIRIGG